MLTHNKNNMNDTGTCEKIGFKPIWKGDIKIFNTYKSTFRSFQLADIVPAQETTPYIAETARDQELSLSLSSPGYVRDKKTGRVLFFANSHGEIIPQLQIAQDKGIISFPSSISDYDMDLDELTVESDQAERELFDFGITGYFASWISFGTRNQLWDKSTCHNFAPKGYRRPNLTNPDINEHYYTDSDASPPTQIVSIDLDIFNDQPPEEEEKILQAIIGKCKTAKLVMVFMSPGHNRNPNVFKHAHRIYQGCIESDDKEFSIA